MNAGYGRQRQLRWERSAVQARSAEAHLPNSAGYCHELGRYGEDMASHVLQRAESGGRGAPSLDQRGPVQPQGQKGGNDPGVPLISVL